ncbi:diacylglycerol kinase family lipid kinase [Actinobacteria bacterium YIM 96077]|uniref:Diacylglycerol kinase family lipid kinase n=1 Tax=Phytoactinopolyspora halophila TaxID=1981511 RepID=A0A329QR28_9ACTN|nr:diacylglycerol kinase family protein [Phytoactinopolyspora halophila]AYY14263.1 diacylglycerol kinase family lipid kinase [Actinobacteria bacterium YIM 96077]RAW14805.1 diacylglycerol kinase family lipid kinase [Phytoactinopolyspora halophila]
MRTFTAVVNPHAGAHRDRRRVASTLTQVSRILRQAGSKVSVEHSRDAGHAADLAAEAAERGDVVVAVGGDGTVGNLAGVAVRSGGALGLIPGGRGNDLARQLGLSRDPARLAGILLHAEPQPVDVLHVADRIVVNSVYAGIDAVANLHLNRVSGLGALGYHYGVVRAMLGWRMRAYRVTVDGNRRDFRGNTVVVANSGYYGRGRHAAPDARIDDGQADVVTLEDLRLPAFVNLAMRELYRGTHVRRPEVTIVRGQEVTIEADPPLPAGGDGELIGTLPVTVRVRPGALRMLTPALPASPPPSV